MDEAGPSFMPEPTLHTLLGFDALDAPASGASVAVDNGQTLLQFVVPPLRGLYRPVYQPIACLIPNTVPALAVATRSVVRALSMLTN